jgi:hypothetical protein
MLEVEDGEGQAPKGLMKYFTKISRDSEAYKEQQRRSSEIADAWRRSRQESVDQAKAAHEAHLRESTRMRQQRYRKRAYEEEISRGDRTPGGTKRVRKVTSSWLAASG